MSKTKSITDLVTELQNENESLKGLKKGFKEVESAPLVRSSYHAEKHIKFKG